MTPPILYELLDDLDAFIAQNCELLDVDADEFYRRLRRFVIYLICRSEREGRRNMPERN